MCVVVIENTLRLFVCLFVIVLQTQGSLFYNGFLHARLSILSTSLLYSLSLLDFGKVWNTTNYKSQCSNHPFYQRVLGHNNKVSITLLPFLFVLIIWGLFTL